MAGLTGPDVVIASEAKQSRLWWTRTGLLRRFSAKLLRNLSRAPRNDKLSHSRGAWRPSSSKSRPPENRGRRECRAPGAPAASRAIKKAHERSHHRFAENVPAFPARWF